MTLVTALIYSRVSSQEQATEGVSLDAQLSEARRYALRHDWVIGHELCDIMSGKRDDRPEYQRLLTEVRTLRAQGTSVVVVVAALDRFGRRLLERVRAREELKALGVPVHSVREGGEVSDLISNILASVAQEESRRLGERVRASHEYFTARGWHLIGRIPWGYLTRDATEEERANGAPQKVLDVDPATAPSVVEAFSQAAHGASIRAVTRWVTNLPTAERGGRHLTYTTMRKILANRLYVADPPARWPALISVELFAQVQQHMADHRQHPHQATGRYLLSSYLRCSLCGGRVIGTRGGHGRWARYHYRCSEATNRGHGWCSWTLGGKMADRAVLAVVEPVLAGFQEPSLLAIVRQQYRAQQVPSESEAMRHNRVQRLRREADKAREQLKRVTTLYVDREIDRPGYELMRDTARTDLEAAEAEISRTAPLARLPGLPSLESVLKRAPSWLAELHSGDTTRQRAILGLLVAQVTVEHLGRSRYHPYIAHVTWTPLGQVCAMVTAEAFPTQG